MLNENFRLSPIDARRANIAWTAPTADAVSWIFIDGKWTLGPLFLATTDRMVPIRLASDQVATIEVHDFDDGSIQAAPIVTEPNTRPTILWNPVGSAVRYRIYHRQFGDTVEEIIYDKPALQGLTQYQITCPVELDGTGGKWHFFRVEAVDLYGHESTRQSWAFFVMDLPAAPPKVTVTEGSGPGLYNLSLD